MDLARRTLSPSSSSRSCEQACRSMGKRFSSSSRMCSRISSISRPTSRSNSGSAAPCRSRSFMICSAVAWSSISLSAMRPPSGTCSRTAGYRYSSSAMECRTSSIVTRSASSLRASRPGGSASISRKTSSTSPWSVVSSRMMSPPCPMVLSPSTCAGRVCPARRAPGYPAGARGKPPLFSRGRRPRGPSPGASPPPAGRPRPRP